VQTFSGRLLLDSFTPLQCALGVLLMLLLGAAGAALHINLSTASLLYLLLVVSFAVHCGFFQASILSIAAVMCQTYFFAPPAYSFYIADPRNAVAIVIFEVTALIVSQLSAREKAHALESRRQRTKLQRLYTVSRRALMIDVNDSAEQQMAEIILDEFQLDGVAICNSEYKNVGVAGCWVARRDELCQGIRNGEFSPVLLPSRTMLEELKTAHGTFGTLLLRGEEMTPLGLESLASLVALTVERHRAFLKEGEAQAARRTEQLRTTVLDGLAHAFKTPLTIIRAASSGLLEVGKMTDLQSELTGMIDEQSAWLDDLANRLLQTAQVDGENLCLELETVDVAALLHEVVADFQQEWARGVKKGLIASPIHISLPEEIVPISADHDMLRSTLSELLENAVKYSRSGKPISLSASHGRNELNLSVHSWGSVIRLDDRERIFERFYRCREHQELARGTGIGLSVARRTAEAHMGNIWVTSSEQEGTTFNISLPLHLASMEQEERMSNWQLKY
jgi:two-component system sensor histidine kinase KdpD